MRSLPRLVGLGLLLSCSPPPTATSGEVPLPGSWLYYERAGHGSAVVLLHSGFLDRRIWDPQFAALAKGHLVIRYDVRGLGRSGPASAPFSQAEDLAALLRSLGVGRVSLVGNSLGGATAIDFAALHPDAVERLVLVGPGLSGFPWREVDMSEPWRVEARAALARGDTVAAAESWLHSSYLEAASETPAVAAQLRSILGENAGYWKGMVQRNSEVYDTEPTPPSIQRLTGITCPVLIVVGDRDDPDILRLTDTLLAHLPSARRVMLPGVGHIPSLEAPERFNDIVFPFLAAR